MPQALPGAHTPIISPIAGFDTISEATDSGFSASILYLMADLQEKTPINQNLSHHTFDMKK